MSSDFFYTCWQDTPLGNIHFVADQESLLVLAFDKTITTYLDKFAIHPDQQCENEVIHLARKQLTEYFEKKRTNFTIPFRLIGSEFELKVWNSLISIPFGIKKSYAEQANDLNKRSAVRAIASANGRNPLNIIIPCHRILRKDGSLGGYSGGLDIKAKLLQLEESI